MQLQQWQDFTCTASDGLKLSGRKYGWDNPSSYNFTPVVCLSGITGNSADFHEVALQIANDARKPRRVLTIDYRGRGKSEHDKNKENYNILQESDDTLNAITAAGLHHINLIASSHGGMIAMLLAGSRPGIIASVVLNDVGPQMDARGILRSKTYISKTTDFSNWKTAEDFLKTIGQSNFPYFEAKDWQRQARRLFRNENSKIIRNYDPAILKGLEAIDLDNPIPDMWAEFTGLTKKQVLLICAENSDFLSKETIIEMQKIHSNMEVVSVNHQGHAPDLATTHLGLKIINFFNKQSDSL